MFTMVELEADRRKVYQVGPTGLLELADKYGVETKRMRVMRANPESMSTFMTPGIAMFPSKSEVAQVQRLIYSAIKTLQAEQLAQ